MRRHTCPPPVRFRWWENSTGALGGGLERAQPLQTTLPASKTGSGMRIAFINSWIATSYAGSGMAVAISGLDRALRRRGHDVVRVAPATDLGGDVWERLRFNLQVPSMLTGAHFDLVVGFGIDGSLLPRS